MVEGSILHRCYLCLIMLGRIFLDFGRAYLTLFFVRDAIAMILEDASWLRKVQIGCVDLGLGSQLRRMRCLDMG